jgi:hypothetical protein
MDNVLLALERIGDDLNKALGLLGPTTPTKREGIMGYDGDAISDQEWDHADDERLDEMFPESQHDVSEPTPGDCRYCGGLKTWTGDAPLPPPIVLGYRGLTEIHCGHDGAASPRFTFWCPVCGSAEPELLAACLQAVGTIQRLHHDLATGRRPGVLTWEDDTVALRAAAAKAEPPS